jgi:nicotinamide-nucleotide amidase
VAQAEALVRATIGDHIVSDDNRVLEQVVVAELAARGMQVATAESCTGGLLTSRLTDVPGSSAVLQAGWVTYANEAKTRELGVPSSLLAAHGAVSEPVAVAMARGALERSGAHHALALTGIAGPGGGSEHKPVGTVFVALASRGLGTLVLPLLLPGSRDRFKLMATQAALDLLRRRLLGLGLRAGCHEA